MFETYRMLGRERERELLRAAESLDAGRRCAPPQAAMGARLRIVTSRVRLVTSATLAAIWALAGSPAGRGSRDPVRRPGSL
jgi:hypothetical protein